MFEARSLLGDLAASAERMDLQRTAQQCELSQAPGTFDKLVHVGNLDVVYPPAADAKNMMVRLDVAVIASDIVQERYLARLTDVAKFVKDAVDGGQGYVGMLAAHGSTDVFGARVILRSEQGLYYRQPLGSDGDTAFAASRDEFAEPPN
jgi:hypothetical protein